jgi:hypothetical protein
MSRLFLILLAFVLLGAMPDWSYSGGLGYYSGAALALVVGIAIVFTLRRV